MSGNQKRPGVFRANIMRVKESENLNKLAKVAKKKPSDLSYEIYAELVKSDLIAKDDIWGATVLEALPPDRAILETVKAMERLGIKSSSANIARFLDLVLILDGDCPECGYDMDVVDGEYKTEGDGYNDPIEHYPVWEYKKCAHCGHVLETRGIGSRKR